MSKKLRIVYGHFNFQLQMKIIFCMIKIGHWSIYVPIRTDRGVYWGLNCHLTCTEGCTVLTSFEDNQTQKWIHRYSKTH
jgi:hypothetical protein